MLENIEFRKLQVTIKEAYKTWVSFDRKESLDDILEKIKASNPRMFHDENTLKGRVFFDEPRTQHRNKYLGFIKPAKNLA